MKNLLLAASCGTMLLSGSINASEKPVVVVSIDPRIELMSAVQLVNGYMLSTEYDSVYRRNVLEYFSRYRDHEACRMLEEMGKDGFAFDAVPKVMVTLSDPPDLRRVRPIPPDVLERAGGAERLEEWVQFLREFAEISKFETFLEANRGSLDRIVEDTRTEVEESVAMLANYTGSALPSSFVILGPLLHHGGYAAVMEDESGKIPVAFVGPVGADEGLPSFGSAERIGSILWHEFSHTIVNPLAAAEIDRIVETETLLDPIAGQMSEQAYPDWPTVLREHLVRAIVVRLNAKAFGEEAGINALAKERKRGFMYIDSLVERLAEYEERRDRYPSLESFFPRLLDALDEIQDSSTHRQ